jgi:hypothetical protein
MAIFNVCLLIINFGTLSPTSLQANSGRVTHCASGPKRPWLHKHTGVSLCVPYSKNKNFKWPPELKCDFLNHICKMHYILLLVFYSLHVFTPCRDLIKYVAPLLVSQEGGGAFRVLLRILISLFLLRQMLGPAACVEIEASLLIHCLLTTKKSPCYFRFTPSHWS